MMLRHLISTSLFTTCLVACGQTGASRPQSATGNINIGGSEAANFFANLTKTGAKAVVTAQSSSLAFDMLQCQVSTQGRYCWLMQGQTQLNAGQQVDSGVYAGLYQELANYGAERGAGRALETYAYDVSCTEDLATTAVTCSFRL